VGPNKGGFRIVLWQRFDAASESYHLKEPVLRRVVLNDYFPWFLPSGGFKVSYVHGNWVRGIGLERFAQPGAGYAERGESRSAGHGTMSQIK